ncbi:MAG: xanthine dehydrogenase family protein subunit M [Thermodesulfobacteriota bacterium]|nr:xanthine dehydrogenase family protein subunit M [Thermodesulfobacteriota bacterium]
MRLPRFEYSAPKTIDEAVAILSEKREDAKIIAGGTDILVNMKHRMVTPKHLVSLKEIKALEYIKNGKGDIRIGALTTLHSIEGSKIIRERLPALAEAADSVGAPQHRYSGTLGGNICLDTRCWYYNQSHFWRKCRPVCYKLGGEENNCQGFGVWDGFPSPKGNVCYAVYSGDTAPSLIALGAELKINGHEGERVVPLKELFTGDGKKPLSLDAGDILTEVIIPTSPPYSSGVYLKLRWREAIDFPLVGVGVNISLDSKDGVCEGASVVVGAVASNPIKVAIAEDILFDKKITDKEIEEVSQAAYDEVNPLPNIGSCSSEYRKKMVKVLTRRAINKALQNIKSA